MGDFEMGGGLGEGLDIGGAPREDVNKITEEDRKRVQEDGQKAKQASQQIKKDKKTNNDMADFLGLLLKKISNEKIISGIYNVFFKVKNPKTDITYLRKNPNTMVIVGIFAPFYKEEIKDFNLHNFFDNIDGFEKALNMNNYVNYLKDLSGKYHDNIPINKEDFLNFLFDVIIEFGLLKNDMKDREPLEFRKNLENMLYLD